MKKIVLIALMSFSLGACSAPNSDTINDKKPNEIFNISSLNGNSYYYLYDDPKEIRIPEKEIPYTYNIPEYLSAGSFSSFSWIEIRDSKVFYEYLDFNRSDNAVTYTKFEEEVSLTIIDNRFFTNVEGHEMIFSKDLIYFGGVLATKEYAIKNGYTIYNLESQQKSWVVETARDKTRKQIRDIIESLTEENNTATLPNKMILNEENPRVELNVSYEITKSSDYYELNGYTLTLKQSGPIDFDFIATFEYEGKTYSSRLYLYY